MRRSLRFSQPLREPARLIAAVIAGTAPGVAPQHGFTLTYPETPGVHDPEFELGRYYHTDGAKPIPIESYDSFIGSSNDGRRLDVFEAISSFLAIAIRSCSGSFFEGMAFTQYLLVSIVSPVVLILCTWYFTRQWMLRALADVRFLDALR